MLPGRHVALSLTDAQAKPLAGGTVRALAVSGKERVTDLPNVPTFAEAGMPTFDANSWLAVVVRTGTPKETVDKLGQSVASTMNDPAVRQRLQALGVVPVGALPDESQKFVEKEIGRYSQAIQKAGIKTE